jgi:predicted O-linked N-acetylglucosamine transferase (SPINDLY family)
MKAAFEHFEAGRMDRAIETLRAILRRNPKDDQAQLLLGCALFETHQDEAAAYALRQSVAANPADGQRWVFLGRVLLRKEGPNAAIKLLEDALAGPLHNTRGAAPTSLILAQCYHRDNRLGDAIAACRRAVAIDPTLGPALVQLGTTLFEAGEIEEAIAAMRQGVASNPNDIRRLATYCFYLNYSDAVTPAEVFAAHRKVGEVASRLMPPPRPLAPNLTPGRPLRVGLVSGDFRQHSVRYFLPALLDHLDKSAFEIVLMSITRQRDEQTEILKAKAAGWVDATDLDFAGFGETVRKARPDILIDLGGLTGGSRVIAFASRLAPVQLTYLGYCNTSGIPNVDGRLVDAITDPPGAEAFATEPLIRLPECFLCYTPDAGAPEPAMPPAGTPITFLSFNNSNKFSPTSIALWSRVLHAVPGSRLRLKSTPLSDPSVRATTFARFAAHQIDPARLDLLGRDDSAQAHLAKYNTGHIALDTTPYAGTTTTCEALWMGVPVVTLRGQVHAARVGASLVAAIGHPAWAAGDGDGFVRIASELASSHDHLAALRASLRDQVAASTLCNASAFAVRFGAALHQLWSARTLAT